MIRKTLDWKKSCKLHFGAHTQVYEERNMTNTLEERIQGAICLGPTDNLQETYIYIYSLRSGKKTARENSQRCPPPRLS